MSGPYPHRGLAARGTGVPPAPESPPQRLAIAGGRRGPDGATDGFRMGLAERLAACAIGYSLGIQALRQPSQPPPNRRIGESGLGPLFQRAEVRAAQWYGLCRNRR